MFLAACISRNVWGSKLFRVVFFFPNLLGGVAATLLWLHVYNPQGGLVVIVFGLHTMGVIHIPFLDYDTRRQQDCREPAHLRISGQAESRVGGELRAGRQRDRGPGQREQRESGGRK